jgi:hypothetical protein
METQNQYDYHGKARGFERHAIAGKQVQRRDNQKDDGDAVSVWGNGCQNQGS